MAYLRTKEVPCFFKCAYTSLQQQLRQRLRDVELGGKASYLRRIRLRLGCPSFLHV